MKKIIVLLALVILVSGCAQHKVLTITETATLDSSIGQTYYTLTNIWFPSGNREGSNNIHRKGSYVLQAGNRVKIIARKGVEIDFVDDLGIVYALVLNRGNTIDLLTFFNRHFSKENPMADGGLFSKFSKLEQENIKNSTIDYGMSKEAILMAYDYPPAEEGFVPDITVNKWVYLENEKQIISVYFKDNRVVKIEDAHARVKRFFYRPKSKVIERSPGIQPNVSKQKNSNADEIAKYKKLLDSGAITQNEYDLKKKQLLGL